MRYVLDTNAVVYLVNGRLAAPLPEGRHGVSIITEIELLSFPELGEAEEFKIRRLLHVTDRIPLSDAVRDQTVRLRRAYRMRLPDAIIAASAMVMEATLLTNDRQLSAVPGLPCRELPLK